MAGLAASCKVTYNFVDDSVDFATAQAYCKNNFAGGSLATFRNGAERQQFNNFVATVNEAQGKDVWVGATRASDDNNRFFWAGNGASMATTKDQEIAPYNQPGLENLWHTNEPNNLNGNEACAVFGVRLSNALNDLSCQEKRQFVCEARCDVSYSLIKDKGLVTQDYAQRYCQKNFKNGALATMRTTKEVEDFEALMAQNDQFRPWVGLQKCTQTQKFFWGSSGIQLPDHHAIWHENEPNNLNGNENCVHYKPNIEVGFNDLSCEGPTEFVCESRAF